MPRLALIALVLLCACRKLAPAPADAGLKQPVAPVAPRHPTSFDFHGEVLTDDYAWMKHKGPEVEAWLQQENAYTLAVAARWKPLEERLTTELLSHVKEADSTVPSRWRGYEYWSRTEPGQPYGLLLRRKLPDGPEQLLLDWNELGRGKSFVGQGEHQVSDDGQWLAWTIDTKGSREFVLHVKDLAHARDLDEAIGRVSSVDWAADSKTLFYTVLNEASRSARVYRHLVGSTGPDPLVYDEKDERFDVTVRRSRSGRFLELVSESLTTTEIRVADAAAPTDFKVLLPRKDGVMYDVGDQGDELLIRLNDTAPGFRVVQAKLAAPTRAWKQVVPPPADGTLTDLDVFDGFFVVRERRDGRQRLRFFEKGGRESVVDAPAGGVIAPESNPEASATSYRYTWENMVTPASTVERVVATGEERTLKVEPVPHYDAAAFVTTRVSARAADGVDVPISLAWKQGTPRDGTAPMYLRAYGAYGDSTEPAFDPMLLPLLDRGVVVALAHVRGGGERGQAWHDAGAREAKVNTFTDFIACAEHLTAERWAAKDRLAINGASAGGLLMGAVLNMRPELFRAAYVEVPFVDVINSMLDTSVPLTVQEFEEWGNPKDPVLGALMRRYSPYDNVKAQAYPAMLVRGAYNDRQVLFHEPAKWVAKLRSLKTDSNPLLLRMVMEPAGHGGRSGRFDTTRDEAFAEAFLLTQLGVER